MKEIESRAKLLSREKVLSFDTDDLLLIVPEMKIFPRLLPEIAQIQTEITTSALLARALLAYSAHAFIGTKRFIKRKIVKVREERGVKAQKLERELPRLENFLCLFPPSVPVAGHIASNRQSIFPLQ